MGYKPTQSVDDTDLCGFFLAFLIIVIWSWLSLNLNIDVYAYYIIQTLLVALLIVFSAAPNRRGSRNIGFFGLVIGLAIYMIPVYLFATLPPEVLLLPPVLSELSLMSTLGSGITLFSTTILALWMSSHMPEEGRILIKLGAAGVAGVVIFSWIYEVDIILSIIGIYPFGLPGTELFYYIPLIITSSVFIPRRQGIDVFYFFSGIVLVLYGLYLISTNPSFYIITGSSLRVLGMILIILFALPLGAGGLRASSHPEHKIYIALPLWFIAELLDDSLLDLTFTTPKAVFIALILYVAVKNMKLKQWYLSLIGGIIGASIAIYGAYLHFLAFPFYLAAFLPLILSKIGIFIYLYFVASFGASFRKAIATNPTRRLSLTIIGSVLVSGGFAIGLFSGIAILGSEPSGLFLYSFVDPIFYITVSFGSMIVSLKPKQYMGIISSLALAILVSISFSRFIFTPLLLYFPVMAMMIFFGIQWNRADSKSQTPSYTISTQSTVQKPLRPTAPEIVGGEESAPAPQPQIKEQSPLRQIDQPPSPETDAERMFRNWFNRAVAFRNEGQIDEAIQSVETALTWMPGHSGALELLRELKGRKNR
jgi:hypothetical protein